MALRRAHDDGAAVRITTAAESRDADISARQRRYVISMTIRTLCFVGAVAVGPGWLRWVLVAAALGLPYIAVIMANVSPPRADPFELRSDLSRTALPPGRANPPERPFS
ncbi:DUF3099 domain-containing protein [uncultured Nocardioides sp.]|uniref:DUF3099 domain-containing protein n=1 Tax=uncultured Nocardioides sp. TaxID=198441 RepID=UPI0025D3F844|nr:DUF3099 domain-containing protein [uncultured Nocardioides sp.]